MQILQLPAQYCHFPTELTELSETEKCSLCLLYDFLQAKREDLGLF